jgi:multidrug resistance efflux pump
VIEMLFGFYAFGWWLIFKKFKLLPINLWTSFTSVFILLAVLAFGFMWLNRYQPMTKHARTYAITTAMIAEVTGKVSEVHVLDGGRVTAGQPLLSIDPEAYEARVAALQAQFDLASQKLERETKVVEGGAGTAFELAQTQAEVDRLTAELRAAQYQLDRTTIIAPADGAVVQVTVRPGQFVMPMQFVQLMVFVHDEGPYLVAGFNQTQIEFIDPGDSAEVAFDALPGRIFSAKVKAIQPALAEGTLTARGSIDPFLGMARRGRIPVLLVMDEEVNLPAGAGARVSVYTGKKHHLDLLRKMILRIKSWENWVPFHFALGH